MRQQHDEEQRPSDVCLGQTPQNYLIEQKFRAEPKSRLFDPMSAHDSVRRHCERSEAIQLAATRKLDCFVATLLAMTGKICGLAHLTSHDDDVITGRPQ
jgi:hypothetical protein